jgi:hypothetical protein
LWALTAQFPLQSLDVRSRAAQRLQPLCLTNDFLELIATHRNTALMKFDKAHETRRLEANRLHDGIVQSASTVQAGVAWREFQKSICRWVLRDQNRNHQ